MNLSLVHNLQASVGLWASVPLFLCSSGPDSVLMGEEMSEKPEVVSSRLDSASHWDDSAAAGEFKPKNVLLKLGKPTAVSLKLELGKEAASMDSRSDQDVQNWSMELSASL
ncbi:unnamed protein product [Pleuronectes platessa]|uniref:Uncharacterized protein n=1 Tax=Pleuronectes platessa TaxID=8262 RepID=A0A9N7VTY9_PLEPL|nr:unnamed protein product [Pleuronectes platessa]